MKKAQPKKIMVVAMIGTIMSGCAATHDVVGRYQSFKSLDLVGD